jgi:hypothetical protein
MLNYGDMIRVREFNQACEPGFFGHCLCFTEGKKEAGTVAGPFESFEHPETGEVLYRIKTLVNP